MDRRKPTKASVEARKLTGNHAALSPRPHGMAGLSGCRAGAAHSMVSMLPSNDQSGDCLGATDIQTYQSGWAR